MRKNPTARIDRRIALPAMLAPTANRPFRTALALWRRLTLIASAAGLFCVLLYVLVQLDGWLHYQSFADTANQIAQLILVVLGTAAIGSSLLTIITTLLPPWRADSVQRRGQRLSQIIQLAAVIFCSLVLWRMIFVWTAAVRLFSFPFV